jgi:hypothetical protein
MSLRLHAIVTANLPEATDEVIAHREPISVSGSIRWVSVKSHQYSKPPKRGRRTSAWRVDEIFALISHPDVRNE